MGLQSNSRETPHATFAELAAFRAKAIEMGYPSLAPGALIGWELLQREAHMFIRFVAEHYRPPSRPNVINYKTSTGSWEPLFNAKGKPLYPVLMTELDAIKALRPDVMFYANADVHRDARLNDGYRFGHRRRVHRQRWQHGRPVHRDRNQRLRPNGDRDGERR